MKKFKPNRSKTYLLPLLSELVDLEPRYHRYIKNTYIADDMEKYKDCIILEMVFPTERSDFAEYEDRLINNQYFVELFDDNNIEYIVFKFPEDYLKEYNMYLEGKYSYFGDDAKNLILRYLAQSMPKNQGTVRFLLKVKDILYRNPKLRKKLEAQLKVKISSEAELSSISDMDEETFKLSTVLTEA